MIGHRHYQKGLSYLGQAEGQMGGGYEEAASALAAIAQAHFLAASAVKDITGSGMIDPIAQIEAAERRRVQVGPPKPEPLEPVCFLAPDGCDDCSVEPGEPHRHAGCPGNVRALAAYNAPGGVA